MAVRRMPYELFAEYLEKKFSNYFQDMNLSEYLSQAITYDMDACVSRKIGPPKKRYCNNFSMDEMVDWAKMEVEQHGGSSQCPKKPKGDETSTRIIDKGIDATEGVKARTSTTDKGKEKVSQDATEVVEARRSMFESDYDSEYDSDDDSDYQSDKSLDYLSPDEEELIELRNRMKTNREAKAKAKDNPVS
ncbi:hypothetical protein Tco_0844887 [Tanacetum coccineum]